MLWKYETTPLLTSEEISQYEKWAKQSGFPAECITATGATQTPRIQDN
jgi:hypothetical protein